MFAFLFVFATAICASAASNVIGMAQVTCDVTGASGASCKIVGKLPNVQCPAEGTDCLTALFLLTSSNPALSSDLVQSVYVVQRTGGFFAEVLYTISFRSSNTTTV